MHQNLQNRSDQNMAYLNSRLSLFNQIPRFMKKIMSLVALAAIFTLSSFVSRTPPGQGPFNSVETVAVEGSFFNECTGEWILYTGTAHSNVFGMFRANKIFV